MRPKVLVILGPTASGKSDFAVALARRFNGEIISADSRQVYKGMDLGTGKITKKEMRGIPHHLLDVASPKKIFTAGDYGRLAKQAIKKILAKGKLPIICGGTGFYIAAALEKNTLAEVLPDPALRKKLENKTTEELFAELTRLDPERAASIDPKNPRRLIRAIEIVKALGITPPRNREEEFDALKLGVYWPKEALKKRIRARIIKRVRMGMIHEIERLHERGVSWKKLDDFGLEYRYISRYLRGASTKAEMLGKLEQEIINYSKRQMTWFKKDRHIIWLSKKEKAGQLIRLFLAKK